MIDYYRKEKCSLNTDEHDKKCPMCKNCIWLDTEARKCIFSMTYEGITTKREFKARIKMVDEEQQKKLSEPKRRFIVD